MSVPGFHGEINQQGEVLLGPKPDRLAGRGEESRLTHATEVPSRFHRVSLVGFYRSQDRGSLQLTINGIRTGTRETLSFCHNCDPTTAPQRP